MFNIIFCNSPIIFNDLLMEPTSIKSYLEELSTTADRILLLQGPIGTFFSDFADWLHQQCGKTV